MAIETIIQIEQDASGNLIATLLDTSGGDISILRDGQITVPDNLPEDVERAIVDAWVQCEARVKELEAQLPATP